MDSGDESQDAHMSTEMLEDILDQSQSHPIINRRYARYKIRDSIKQGQSEWKVELQATPNIGKGSYRLFKTYVKDILQDIPIFGESGSEVSYFIPDPRKFAEVTRFSDEIKKPWLNETQKEIKNLINNQTFLVEDPEKDDPVTPCIDVYKAEIQSNGSLDKLKLRIVVRGYLQNKKLVGDTWSPTASMRNLKYFLTDAVKHKAVVHHLYFIGPFLQAKVISKKKRK